MKNLILILLCCILFNQVKAQNQYTIIRGKITKQASSDINITIVTDLLSLDKTILSTPLNTNGEFILAFQPSVPMLVRFEHAFENRLIWIAPGAEIKLSFEAENMWKTIKFEGDCANNNNYLTDFYNKFEREVDQTYINIDAETMDIQSFNNYVNERKNKQKQFYTDYKTKKTFTEQFEEIALGDINYNWAFDKIRYAELKNISASNSYFDFLNDIKPANPLLISSNTYNSFLFAYLNYAANKQNNNQNTSTIADKYKIAKTILNDNLLYFTLARIVLQACDENEFEYLDEIYDDFDLNNPYSDYHKIIVNAYNNAKKFAPGNPAPDFTLTNMDGKPISLSDYKGKVVYLAFWASWCSPCRQQIDYIKEINKTINNDEFAIIYVSIDENETAWKNMVAKKQAVGTQLISKGLESAVPKEYNVGGVPLYYMIDKKGNFTTKPPRPSVKNAFIKQVEDLLNAN